MRTSVAVLLLVAGAGCYGTPRQASADGRAGDGGGKAGSDAGTVDAEPDTGPGASGGMGGIGGAVGGAGGAAGEMGASDAGQDASAITCDATSPPAAPALRRPMRGAYTGSLHAPMALATLRPNFSWNAVAPTCGAVSYHIQADDSCVPGALDACAFPSPELDVRSITTTNHAPATDLKVSTTPPAGAFYGWRVRACDASARCSAWSEVRYLHVGRVREDINGDGYGDLLALSNRGIEVYLGSSQFNVSAPSHTIAYSSGWAPSFAGDVNGDGYGDLFGTTNYVPSSGFAPTVIFGGANVAAPATLVLTKAAGGPSTLMQTTSAGDMNGDGFADVIVQWGYTVTTPQTELRVFFGGTTLANTPDLTIPGPFVSAHTLQDSGRVGDLNGDGFEDIALGAVSDQGANGGMVQVFAGGLHPSVTPINIPSTAATHQVEPAGDVDGDGFDDLLIVLTLNNYALYRGAAKLPTAATTTWTDSTAVSGAGGFDIDRDGYSDFVIGRASNPILYRGGAPSPSLVSNGLSRLNASVIIAHSDHDGDGRIDFAGVSGETSDATVQWAGSDGTTNPRAVKVYLPLGATFSSQLVR
jgi:hypothetical protein